MLYSTPPDGLLMLAVVGASQAVAQADAERRRTQLAKGFAALAEAAVGEGGAADGAGNGGGGITIARAEDVQAVLSAQSDYEVLQVSGGGDRRRELLCGVMCTTLHL